MLNIILRLIAIVVMSLALVSCKQTEPLYTSQHYVFGTLVDISIYGAPRPKAEAASNQIIRTFQTLHNRLHAWHTSELNDLNQAIAKKKRLYIEPDLAKLLTQAREYSMLSDGLFNPAIANLIKFWGFQNDKFHAVEIDNDRITALLNQQAKMADLTIKNSIVSSKNPNVKLDLGGYAKGYALDIAYQILQEQGIQNALVNIGGNVIAKGQHGDKPWRVGIQHPRKPSPIAAVDLLDGWAIGTSGDYQRFFMLDGKRYHHLIDPRTGFPAQGTQAVTVLIPPQQQAGVLSDVASKPIFIADNNQKATYADKFGVEYFMVILDSGKILLSPKLQKQLEWLDEQAQQDYKIIR